MKKLEEIKRRRDVILQSYPEITKETSAIRGEVVKKLPELLTNCQETLQEKGCQVYFAKTAQEAQEILSQLLAGQSQVARAYSNTLQEIAFDDFSAEKSIKVNKTNVAEIINENLKEKSSGHPLFPMGDTNHGEVIDSLNKYLGANKISDEKQLMKSVHQKIKDNILHCEFGVTGINSIIAENGTIILVEDEGNARAVSNLPYRHVVVAGLDKITNTVEEAMTTIQAATIYGLGRNNPTYYSLISGPSRTADIEFRMAYGMHGPKEVHVILLDNGRQELLNKGCGEVLKCIDCGSCYHSLQVLAQENNWDDLYSLTPKTIALGVIQGKISAKTVTTKIKDFQCPVGLTSETIGQILKKM